jgi:hypothetical protein
MHDYDRFCSSLICPFHSVLQYIAVKWHRSTQDSRDLDAGTPDP